MASKVAAKIASHNAVQGAALGIIGMVGLLISAVGPIKLPFAETLAKTYYRQAMVGLKVNGDLRAIADEIAAIPEVDYVVICAGGFDLLVELVCTDDSHLLDLLNEKVRPIKGVTSCETFMYLKLAKQTYAWGTR